MNDNTSNAADTFASYLERMTGGDLAERSGASFRSDTIAPTESAAEMVRRQAEMMRESFPQHYGRRTVIVEDEGPPSPMSHVFTGKAEHPYVTRKGLVARCRHCWGERHQHQD